MAVDPRLTIRLDPEVIQKMNQKTSQEFPYGWLTAHVARRLIELWFAGKIALDANGELATAAESNKDAAPGSTVAAGTIAVDPANAPLHEKLEAILSSEDAATIGTVTQVINSLKVARRPRSRKVAG